MLLQLVRHPGGPWLVVQRWHRFLEFFFRLTLAYATEVIAHLVDADAQAFVTGQRFVCVALLGNQLLPDFFDRHARVEPLAAKGRIRLALAVQYRLHVTPQLWQAALDWMATTRSKVVDTDDAAFQFVPPFASRLTLTLLD